MAPAIANGLHDVALIQEKAYINGEWVSSMSGKTFDVSNPATGQIIGTAPECGTDDLDAAVNAASKSFHTWRAYSGRQRGRILRKLFDLIVENKVDIGKIITAENGKSKLDAEGEALFAAGFFEWFSEEAPRIYGDVAPHSAPNSRIQVLKQPVGVCGLITPWNFPIAMASRKVSAALAAGCTVVLKSDGVTPFATNVLAVLEYTQARSGTLRVRACQEDLLHWLHQSRENSDAAVQQHSEEAEHGAWRKCPFIVFDDADIETAVASAIIAKFKVTGQTCVCANRIYAQDGIYDSFSKKLVEEVHKFNVGDGANSSVTHGPLTIGINKTEEHVQDAVKKKASILLGGKRLTSLGPNFFELTVLGDVTDDMAVMHEETFGPLAALSRFKTEDEVIKRANAAEVGLAAYLMTSDLNRQYRVSERLEFGMVAINTGVISDPAAPQVSRIRNT
ncbi:hypothetical protein ACCO45_006487 [Purpureocillium lilacinum]|uniref:Uncharacterized protein n=1 Tax=Purpureocillium lilacinum TaxID=33203 RepID=A0ACC4DSR0_PURLI